MWLLHACRQPSYQRCKFQPVNVNCWPTVIFLLRTAQNILFRRQYHDWSTRKTSIEDVHVGLWHSTNIWYRTAWSVTKQKVSRLFYCQKHIRVFVGGLTRKLNDWKRKRDIWPMRDCRLDLNTQMIKLFAHVSDKRLVLYERWGQQIICTSLPAFSNKHKSWLRYTSQEHPVNITTRFT